MSTNKIQAILDGLNDEEKAEMVEALKKVKPKKPSKAAKAGMTKATPTGTMGNPLSRMHALVRK